MPRQQFHQELLAIARQDRPAECVGVALVAKPLRTEEVGHTAFSQHGQDRSGAGDGIRPGVAHADGEAIAGQVPAT